MPTEIPREKILEDLKQTAEQVDGLLTKQDYREHGTYSLWAFQGSDKFENFSTAKEEADLELCKPGYDSDGNPIVKPGISKQEIKTGTSEFLTDTDQTLTKKNLADYLGVTEGALDNRLSESSPVEPYFNGLYGLLESIGYPPHRIYRMWGEVIKNRELYGWVRYDEFRDILSKHSQIMCLKSNSSPMISNEEFFSYVNDEVEGISLRKGTLGGNGTRIYIKNDFVDRFAEYKSELPDVDGAEKVFDKCISYGRGPKSSLAAIRYLCEDKTQKEICDEVGTYGVSLRGARDLIVEEGLDEKLDV